MAATMELYSDESLPASYTGVSYMDETTYEGRMKKGKKEGFGAITFESGDKYAGEFKKGFPDGHGVLRLASGGMYAGCFVDGLFHGYGVFCKANRDEFLGYFEKGKPAGYGMLMLSDGQDFSGTWNGTTLISTHDAHDACEAARKAVLAAKALIFQKTTPLKWNAGVLEEARDDNY